MDAPNLRFFKYRRGTLELGRRTRLMGIVNVTPDSFSDGGKYLDPTAAITHGLKLLVAGADMIDLGAESTRPGSEPTSVALQLERLLPVVSELRNASDAILSVDTRSARVADECLAAGADMINDISGLEHDPELADVCAEQNAGLAVMHMRGTPATMQTQLLYEDLLSDVRASLEHSVRVAQASGIQNDSLLIDPGLGFGKSFEQNYLLLGNLKAFAELGAGVLVGPSRKAFTGEFSKLPAAERVHSTAAAVAISILNGADVLRVHDVAELRQVADICDRYREVMHGRHD
ncbi:MAG: dihydropteroate synthase [bacterium]|nr:dihydropteroate synthase [bacterium]